MARRAKYLNNASFAFDRGVEKGRRLERAEIKYETMTMTIDVIMAEMCGHFEVGYNIFNDYWYGNWTREEENITAMRRFGENTHGMIFRDLYKQFKEARDDSAS